MTGMLRSLWMLERHSGQTQEKKKALRYYNYYNMTGAVHPHLPRDHLCLLKCNLMALCVASQKQISWPLIMPGYVSFDWIR